MSRKTNKLQGRLRIQEQRNTRTTEAMQKRLNLQAAEIKDLRRQLEQSAECRAFKVRINQLEPFRFGRENVYTIQVMFDLWAMRYAAFDFRGDVVNISREVHFLCQNLCSKIERELMKQLTEDGVMGYRMPGTRDRA